ncbi:IS3 family transposase [Hymenobacter sp. BRD67]|uniref:IS3 family transposase n=1 Tax=Hymenobacter sp. BRD67 TaxID=2675877 RepID=UPI00156360DA|nr:IS3 family transposase [Hymenobacter sp. BRD67]QKG54905.1 transposase [Hymenobacter sp. BRD67]
MSPKRTRRRYTAEFKAEVALAALTERQPWPSWPAATSWPQPKSRAGSSSCASRLPRSLPPTVPPRLPPARHGAALRRHRPVADGERAAKKNAAPMSTAQQRQLAQAPDPAGHSVTARCQALGLARSSYYYQPKGESELNLKLMRLLDEEFTRHNFKGVRGLTQHLRLAGYLVNEKRVRRLVRLMGHEPVYPQPRLTVPGQGATPYPYLLRERPATAPTKCGVPTSPMYRWRRAFCI